MPWDFECPEARGFDHEGGTVAEFNAAGRSGDDPAPPEALKPASVTPVFAVGNIGFDFGTEARRDAFRQLIPRVVGDGLPSAVMAPNRSATKQLADYLNANPSESRKLIWTLNLDLTPVYAIEAEATHADEVYSKLRAALEYQALSAEDHNFVSRVSLPGVRTTRTVRLFSGQHVPVVITRSRGLFLWKEAAMIDAVIDATDPASLNVDPAHVRLRVRQMLDKVYYQLRSLGTTSPDRAINFMATNAFAVTDGIWRSLLSGEVVDGDSTSLCSLDTIHAVKSPHCRIESDCWDVQMSFFNPENDNRARVVFQTTIDVSDELPVQLAPTHQFLC
jgi:cyanobactin maturation PatA/PatG family protease